MAARQTGMRLQKLRFSFWFNLKKIARTSVAVGLFVLGLVATLSYIQAETASLKNSESVVQITDRNRMVANGHPVGN